MISVSQADQLIAANMMPFPVRDCPVEDALGCVLREDLAAERDQPPFDRVCMDGIALSFEAWERGQREYGCEGVQAAGHPQLTLANAENCIEVMTGAMLPVGCDTVVRVEDTQRRGSVVHVDGDAKVVQWQNVHKRGTDHLKGALLLPSGQRLGAPEIGIAASVGKAKVSVANEPAVAVVSTGDELVDFDGPLAPYQIRRSNAFAVKAMFEDAGFRKVDTHHGPDNEVELEEILRACLAKYGVLVLSGGVSMGKFDYVPRVLEKLGVRCVFHRVAQRPGKPLWFGVGPEGQPVFGLPGNPVSTLVCCRRYVIKHLLAALGLQERLPLTPALSREVQFKPALTLFLSVRLDSDAGGVLQAVPSPTNTSGDYAALAGTDGFIELPAEAEVFPENTVAPLYPWRL